MEFAKELMTFIRDVGVIGGMLVLLIVGVGILVWTLFNRWQTREDNRVAGELQLQERQTVAIEGIAKATKAQARVARRMEQKLDDHSKDLGEIKTKLNGGRT